MAIFKTFTFFISTNNEDIGQKLLPDTCDHTLMTLKGQSSRSRQGYIGLARCCYISSEQDNFFIIFS